MQYGDSRWQEWVISDEEEAIRHIKAAYDAGIQTFDTANVRWIQVLSEPTAEQNATTPYF
jgi:diketogulonate reductase-like aldo/keto reductase